MNWNTSDIPDLSGRVAVVTGANGGLGLETARAPAAAGATVLLAARNPATAHAARADRAAAPPDAPLELVVLDLGARAAGESTRSSLQIGVGMISRGEVGLIVASVGLAQGLVDTSLFSVMVLMVLITTLVTPVLLKIVFAEEKEEQHAQHGDVGTA